MTPFAVIDFETEPAEYGRLSPAFACGFYDGKSYSYFWHNQESKVLQWAAKKVSRFVGLVFAHNGGRFDFLGYLFRTRSELLYGQPARLIGSRLVSMKYGNAEIRDSYAILPAPLSSYDKGEIDIQLLRKSKRDHYRNFILDYLKRDCTSLYSLVAAFLDRHGSRRITAASAGMAYAKGLGYAIPSLSSGQDQIFRNWYFGGRVDAFFTGSEAGLFSIFDIKSAYPHAMLSEHCASNEFELLTGRQTVKETDFLVVEGFSRGAFPVRTEKGLRYPKQSGTYYVTGWEYLEAKRLKLLGKHTVRFIERPTKTGDFRKYVLFWYGEKERAEKEGDRAGRLIAKIMLNALYGKYAQRPDKWREYIFQPHTKVLTTKDARLGWEEEYVDEKNKFAVWSCPSKRPATYYNVATAASITGNVRARLMRAIDRFGPLCADTDSIIIRGNGTAEMRDSEGIGAWGLEVQGDYFACAGKKLYALRVLPRYCASAKEAKAKGYKWQVRPFTFGNVIFPGNRAWKIASKGCRLTPKEMLTVANGGEVVTFNEFPTFSVKSGTHWISRTIRKTA